MVRWGKRARVGKGLATSIGPQVRSSPTLHIGEGPKDRFQGMVEIDSGIIQTLCPPATSLGEETSHLISETLVNAGLR